MKYIWYMFLPILVMVGIQYAVVIGDVIILFFKNLFSTSEVHKDATVEFIMNSDFKQPMNQAYMTLVQYSLYILVFGIWYYKAFCKAPAMVDNKSGKKATTTNTEDAVIFSDFKTGLYYLRDKLLTMKAVYLLIAGYSAQLMVDGILTLLEPYFKNQFESYGNMVESVMGANSSWVMFFAVIFIAPIGEELLFRGLIQHYGFKNFAPVLAIGLQGLVFGLYHGNIIQGTYAFFMGIVLGFVAYKLGSILYSIVLHISVNASFTIVPVALYETTPKTVVTTIISGLLLIGMIWMAVRKRENIKDTENKNPNS